MPKVNFSKDKPAWTEWRWYEAEVVNVQLTKSQADNDMLVCIIRMDKARGIIRKYLTWHTEWTTQQTGNFLHALNPGSDELDINWMLLSLRNGVIPMEQLMLKKFMLQPYYDDNGFVMINAETI